MTPPVGGSKTVVLVLYGGKEEGQKTSLHDKLAIIFKKMKSFTFLVKQIFVANSNN